MPDKIAMVSGGFDPLHVGHINLLEAASKHGSLLVALNSDEWLLRKKGFAFMPWLYRRAILEALRVVDRVVNVDDEDGTVRDAIGFYRPDYFCNGGDRPRNDSSPEARLCDELSILCLYDVGGPKIESSTALVERALTGRP